ncbi:5-methyltetrahydropteroyltriglutamate--homocysteine S-methyltransferase [Flexivirga oryzae]|uniref:5-methyltetrahydropteroyltriglutamate--homocysteine methyltransferase n=1 Tax=Flexivirga oryzae TaxID=1794944 RepID=A0A839N392_9MICO|nr:5-methyltetrahydropteroyltriglutamate--homocysteine S-methyltransferase [Flexivirga oryzae]MBB2892208.1 5-methyltetrahydropteroyltriglutamate--homocysteine methyltransferase [Flexivirga oryzae]
MSVNPPYRADIVGSFLRPDPIKSARAAYEAGDLSADGLRKVEDEQIAALVAEEAQAGLEAVTDGEFRRSWWHFDFLGGLDGVSLVELDHSLPFQGATTKALGVRIEGRLGFPSDHPMLEHFRYLKSVAEAHGVQPKFSIPSPTVLDFRVEPANLAAPEYPDRNSYVDDLVQTYRDAIAAFYAEGARYLQLDDTVWAYLCSDAELERARTEREIDTDGIGKRYRDILIRVLADKPDDLVITTHVCRGNFRSTWIASGGYEPVAQDLFAVPYDGFFLEYDSERAGGFEPLRFFPKGDQTVVLGLITSKSGELEDPDAVRARIAEAAKFVPLQQLAISTQCGFASTEEGNILTEDEQWGKVREVVELASTVWGG